MARLGRLLAASDVYSVACRCTVAAMCRDGREIKSRAPSALCSRSRRKYMSSEVNEDAAVRTTDQDALLSRFSAHTLGYIRDPHSAAFVSPAVRRSPATARRPPLINLGTHARTCAIDELVRSFILAHQQHGAQVVSLGAGTDTRFWRLRDEWDAAHRPWNLAKWLEVDFQEATAAKSRIVTTKAELKSRLGDAVKLGAQTLSMCALSWSRSTAETALLRQSKAAARFTRPSTRFYLSTSVHRLLSCPASCRRISHQQDRRFS